MVIIIQKRIRNLYITITKGIQKRQASIKDDLYIR